MPHAYTDPDRHAIQQMGRHHLVSCSVFALTLLLKPDLIQDFMTLWLSVVYDWTQ